MVSETVFHQNLQHKRRLGMYLGLLAGFIYSFATWGIDGIILAISHGYLFWLKFLLGLMVMLLIGGICGAISAITGKSIITALLWLGFGYIAGWIGGKLPFAFQGTAIAFINPTLGSEISYTTPIQHSARLFVGWFVTIGLSMIAAFFFNSVLDGIWMGMHIGPRIMNLLLWAAFFTIMGLSIDDLYNRPLRTAVQVTHEAIQTARVNEDKFEVGGQAAALHILGLRPVKQLIQKPYQIAVKSYSDLLDTVQVWVDFDSYWVTCTVANEQIITCK